VSSFLFDDMDNVQRRSVSDWAMNIIN